MTKPVLSDPIALRIPEDMLKDIETIAKATDRSRSWVIVRALKYYLMEEGNDVLQTLKGEEQIRNGETVDFEEFMRELTSSPRDDAA
ncbi:MULTISPECIES: CopG family ribbon-helix-helix protein [Rhizobium]|jgi:predicted transcriptional regulator|uniref:Putative transcriptional regulator n=1 Tax=Rhizobium metallidurans TaxID=1265931 RepID=A0A7W6CSU2_9HYPH|nr:MULTISPECIES: ribbon-helix-helix domain-containing protein [Rhizobium]MBB3963724.1 putative transcriptional regulator [Rhizobium metallidurans]MBO9123222.1 ribbon-helix-helix protein, CopG family [Rhizobium sp. 16-488-2b]MBO9173754.1 ribbon-helix-helix protein, CopG family [Rhizobium sp. 16-488-2a]